MRVGGTAGERPGGADLQRTLRRLGMRSAARGRHGALRVFGVTAGAGRVFASRHGFTFPLSTRSSVNEQTAGASLGGGGVFPSFFHPP